VIEIFGELKDFEVDKQTGISNTVQKFEGFDIKKLLFTLAALIITGFSIIIFTIPNEYKIINISISLIVGFLAIYRMNRRAREFI
jgi:4-hydroxybenzoate polyprenyltransferase